MKMRWAIERILEGARRPPGVEGRGRCGSRWAPDCSSAPRGLASFGAEIVGEFERQAPGSALRALHSRMWVRTMYAFFRLTTGLRVRSIPDYRPLLIDAEYVLRRERRQRLGLIVSELWQKTG